jgi:hypothetical protein
LSAGAFHRTIANPLLKELAVTDAGALGAVGAETANEGWLSPIEFVATTVKL